MDSNVAIQAVVTIVTTMFGYRAVARQLSAGLKTKVDLTIYQAKVTELHDRLNAERERCAALQAEVRLLKQLAHSHAA